MGGSTSGTTVACQTVMVRNGVSGHLLTLKCPRDMLVAFSLELISSKAVSRAEVPLGSHIEPPVIASTSHFIGSKWGTGTDALMALLEDQALMLQSLVGSRFLKPFEQEVRGWEARLGTISEALAGWTAVQRKWMYLETVFSESDIRLQLPQARRPNILLKASLEELQACAALLEAVVCISIK